MTPTEKNRIQKRTTSRVSLELRCLTCRGDEYFEATIRNVCENGAYIECDHLMAPGEKIRIHLLQVEPGEFRCSEINESSGVIRWCRTLSEAQHRRYGAGIRFS